jgi:glycosyltransferase involved in cell wall biosynthesis
MISVIIPTRGNINYLDECIKSILDQKCDLEFEILLGIDACQETAEHVKENQEIYKGVRIFDFIKMFGPYVIKNTLSNFARHENLIFFDSDDIMTEGALQNFCDNIGNSDFAKLNFIEFDSDAINIDKEGSIISGISVGIKSDSFITMNGFYDWMYGADLEFLGRITHKGLASSQIPGAFYYKRIHENSLTEKLSPNPMKKVYLGIVKKNREEKKWDAPQCRITGDYLVL